MILSLTPGSASHEFACHSKACAPPPAGHGGSDKGGGMYRGKMTPQEVQSAVTRLQNEKPHKAPTKLKMGSGMGGKHITHPVRKHTTPNFIDTNKVRHITNLDEWTSRSATAGHRHSTGISGHTKAFIDRVLGVEKYPKRTRAQQVLTRAEARAKGAFS